MIYAENGLLTMDVEVDGKMERRDAQVICYEAHTLGGVPRRACSVQPVGRDGEIVAQSLDGRCIVVRGRG